MSVMPSHMTDDGSRIQRDFGGYGVILERGGGWRRLTSHFWQLFGEGGCFEMSVYPLPADHIDQLFKELIAEQLNMVSSWCDTIDTGPHSFTVGGKFVVGESFDDDVIQNRLAEVVERYFALHPETRRWAVQ